VSRHYFIAHPTRSYGVRPWGGIGVSEPLCRVPPGRGLHCGALSPALRCHARDFSVTRFGVRCLTCLFLYVMCL
jgi:hypothetical protein